MPIETSDRRARPRVTFWSRVHLEAPGGSITASLRNLSMAGIACTTSSPFDLMSQVKVTLDLPPEDGAGESAERLELAGAVVRCEPQRRGAARRRYDVGIFFHDVEDEARKKLVSFIRGRTPEK